MKPANYAPVYAGLYPELAEIARAHGYAMAVHGSMARDADLICIPWTDEDSSPQEVVEAIEAEFAIRRVSDPKFREHGRTVYSLTIAGPGCFIDLSFTPRTTSKPVAWRSPHTLWPEHWHFDENDPGDVRGKQPLFTGEPTLNGHNNDLGCVVRSISEDGFRIVSVSDAQNGDYHVVADKGDIADLGDVISKAITDALRARQ